MSFIYKFENCEWLKIYRRGDLEMKLRLLAAYPLLCLAVNCVNAQSLCSTMVVEESPSTTISCNFPLIPIPMTMKYIVLRRVAYTESCPVYTSHRREFEVQAQGMCGGGGGAAGPDCPPEFSYWVDLVGVGSDYDQYTHRFAAASRSRAFVLGFCVTTVTGYMEWSTDAWRCKNLMPGESCPEIPLDPF